MSTTTRILLGFLLVVMAGFYFLMDKLTERVERQYLEAAEEPMVDTANILASWLEEAKSQGKLKPGVRIKEVADFIVTSVNGAAALYAATRSDRFPRAIERQLNSYIQMLRA